MDMWSICVSRPPALVPSPSSNLYLTAPAPNLYLTAPALNLYLPAPALNLYLPVLRFTVNFINSASTFMY